MRLETLAGTTSTDTTMALAFLRRWYQPGDLITLVGVRKKEPNKPHLLASVHKFEDLVSGLLDDEAALNNFVLSEDGSAWNVYVQVCPAKGELSSPFKRGGDENVATFRGVWVDLDVKPGSFESEEQALQYLRGLQIWPTIIVATGTGGVHAYWRLQEDLDPNTGREFARDWWAYLAEEAAKFGASVDKLVDIARMMRLPGTIRWPKKDDPDGTVATQVRLLYRAQQGDDVNAAEMSAVATDAATRRTIKIRQTRVDDHQRRLSADSVARMKLEGANNTWQLLRAVAQVEDVFNEMVTWDEILEPAGWTFIREDNQERREWARPGREEKSATTDWPESPDVMSLLSSSDETGLFDLLEAGIALTKYRVALRFWFNDDESAMVEWTIGRMSS